MLSMSSGYLKSGSKWSSRSEVTMLLLASYLLIFTVVTSFVVSQPVTNLPNKLISAAVRESSSPSTVGNAADVTSSQQGQLPHLSSLIFPPTLRLNQEDETQQLKIETVTTEAKVERIMLRKPPSQESVHNPNGDDDLWLMTKKSKGRDDASPIPNFSLVRLKRKIKDGNEIGGEVGGELGKEMARDKNKVMVTDDVKMSSGENSNPFFSTQNADQSEGNLWHTPSLFHEDGEDEIDEVNDRGNESPVRSSPIITKIHIPIEGNNNKVNNTKGNLNKSQRIMSTGLGSMTVPDILQERHRNANSINNHANLLQETPERVDNDEKTHTTSKSHTTNKNNSGNNPVTSREHDRDDDDDEKEVDVNGNDNNAESADEHQDDESSDSSRGNLESRLVTKMDNVSLSYLSSFSLQSSSFSPVDKNKGDKGQGEHQSDYYYDSASTDNDELNHPPSPVSPSLLMNKWIKSLVKLSQCRANCLDQAVGGFAVDSEVVTESPSTSFSRGKQTNHLEDYNHDQVGGVKRAPQPPVSSTSNSRDLREKSGMPLVSLPKKNMESNNPHPILPLGAIRTIKATTGSSMKYYELSACQESCKRKFPLAKRPNLATTRASKSINGTERRGNEYAIRNPKPVVLPPTKARESKSDRTGNNSNGNNSSNNNIQRKETPVEMEKADRKSNNNRHQQHHYIPPQKGLVEQHHDENQLSSNLPLRQQQQEDGKKEPIQQQQQLPDGQNKVEEETKRNESSNNSLMKLLAIEQAAKEPGSATNFKTFPSEPQLKVRQVVGRKGKDGFPLHFLQLSWPKPLGGRTIGNNNNRPEGESAQVKDKKGIDDDRDEENEKQSGSQRPKRGGVSSSGGGGVIQLQPTTVYSIILEESWESDAKPDGTRDTYARWWKLIDQIVERTTTQISLPVILPSWQKGSGKEKTGQVTAGAFVQKKEIKGKAMRKNSQRMRMMMPPSLSFSATDPPSKVTLWVLAVTSKEGLKKVYSAELNNSYYHFYLGEHHHDHQEHPNIPRHQQVYRENHKGNTIAVKDIDRSGSTDNPTNLNFSNEKTGNQSVVVSALDKKKEKVKKKVGSTKSSTNTVSIGVDWDGNNENSNQILAFPSKDSSFGRGKGSIKGGSSEKVKKLLTMSSRQNLKSKGENEASTYPTGHDDHTSFTFSQERGMSLSSTENVENWGLHTVSMVYQKFLVVTQVTWEYPGGEDSDFNKEEEEIPNKLVVSRDLSSVGNDDHDHDGRRALNRNTRNDKTFGSTNNTSFSVTLRDNSKIVHDSHEIQSENGRGEMDAGTGSNSNKEHKRCGSGHRNGKGGEDRKLNFLLSWEIFGGGLRGNLVTDTCSASISLWPDTVYIIQVGLITPSDNISKTHSDSDSTFHQQSQSSTFLSSFTTNSAPNERQRDASHLPQTHFDDVDDRDIDNDEMSNSGRKLERDIIDGSLSSPSSSGTLVKSSTISIENGSGEQEGNNLVGNDISKASLDPLILPESITFPFDGGEPKVTIKSERILVNTTRATTTNATTTTLDKISPGNTQTNNNFHKGKDQQRSKTPKKNSDPNTDQVLARVITIRQNGDGQNKHSSPVTDQPTFATIEEKKPEAEEEEADSQWDDDDDEATDQDESLFARYHSHHHHHNEHHQSQGLSKDSPISLAEARRSQPEAEFDHNQKNTKRSGSMKTASLSLLSSSSSPSNGMRYPNFFPVNSFYQSLYALSQNALQVSSRYPSVITINGGLSNKSGSSGDNLAPLILSEFGSSNHSGYLYGNANAGGSSNSDSSAVGGKLYTLFVILVISFVIFLFIVAIVGFCVLTSSIKENYKYFVPKKVRVWTTVGQLLKGSHQSSSSGGAGNSGKDSGEGSFYPRRLHEDPDYEFDDNDDFDPDEDDEEEVTSVADTDEEDDCDCNSDDGRGGPRNTFTLNERSSNILLCSPLLAPVPPASSDTSNLIRMGETEEIRVTLEAPPQQQESGAGESVGDGNGSCDNNNPYYHSMPGNSMLTVGSSSSSATPQTQTCASTAIASFQENYYLTPSSPHHHHSPNNHQRKKNDVRIDVSSSSSSNSRKAPSHQRQQGYY